MKRTLVISLFYLPADGMIPQARDFRVSAGGDDHNSLVTWLNRKEPEKS